MEAATAAGRAGTQADVAVKKKGPKAPGPPWWIYVAVAAVVIFCLLPFYWLVNISLKTGPDLSSADIFPPNPSLDNYESIFQNDDFVRSLGNSAIVSLTTTFLGIVVGAFCAYALARLRMKFKFILLGIVL
jgi:multiple sugar transport system permease protein